VILWGSFNFNSYVWSALQIGYAFFNLMSDILPMFGGDFFSFRLMSHSIESYDVYM
jgi:hypothetical protein